MGLIDTLVGLVFGNGGTLVRDTVGVFRENAESGAQRTADARDQAMAQFTAEFAQTQKGRFDRFIDGLNRLPRPALALGTLGLFVAAMVDPIWFAARMQGIALVPEPLWWLLGVIVSFYFGARHQVKSQEFQRSIAQTVSRMPQVAANIQHLDTLRQRFADPAPSMDPGENPGPMSPDFSEPSSDANANPALEAWRRAAA